MGELRQKLEEVLGAEEVSRLRAINESRKPTQGIWYYIYYEPKWELVVFKADEYGNLSHLEAWGNYIVPKLTTFYGLSEEERKQIEDLYRGFPRGRVDINASPEHIASAGGKFMVFHGGDFPSDLDRAAEEGKIINNFNLASLMVRDLVEVKFHEHEMMVPKHMEVMKTIVGDIPY